MTALIYKLHWQYLYVFLQSNSLEVPFYYLGLRSFAPRLLTRSLRESERILFFICAVTAVNSVTHPVVFFGIMNLKLTYLQNILIAETFAILSESIFMMWLLDVSKLRAIAVATIANLVSWQLAPLLTFKLFSYSP